MNILIFLLSMLMAMPAFSAPLRPLSAQDVPALLAPPAQGVRIIELWALYCAYCETNLRAVAAMSAADANVQAVTVSTDPIGRSDNAIMKRLQSAQAADVPARAYADMSVQRLNYLIDPRWGGETPHTVVIHADGRRRSVSGTLSPAQWKTLLEPRAP